MSHESGSSRYRWVLLSLSCCRRFGEVCLPTRDEIGLVAEETGLRLWIPIAGGEEYRGDGYKG